MGFLGSTWKDAREVVAVTKVGAEAVGARENLYRWRWWALYAVDKALLVG